MICISILLTCNLSYASFLDDVIGKFLTNKEDVTTEDETDKHISLELEESLNQSEKEVVDEIEKIFNDISNVDLDEVIDKLNIDKEDKRIKNIKGFFENYPSASHSMEIIFGGFNYSIVDINEKDDIVKAKITFTYPSIDDIIKKITPTVIIKNLNKIRNGQITNEIIDSALKEAAEVISKGNYDVDSFDYEFEFKKMNGKWKIVNVNDIVNDLTRYFRSIKI